MSQPTDDASPRRAEGGAPRAPMWVWYLVIGLVIAAVVIVVAMVLLGGEHGPGRHGS